VRQKALYAEPGNEKPEVDLAAGGGGAEIAAWRGGKE
jgi:hypothetical protein